MTVVHPVSFESNEVLSNAVVTTPEAISSENIVAENVVAEAPPSDLDIDTDRSAPATSAATIVRHFGLRSQERLPRYPGADP